MKETESETSSQTMLEISALLARKASKSEASTFHL